MEVKQEMTKRPRDKGEDKQNAEGSALVRFRPLLSAEGYRALLEELDKPLRGALRVNPLKVPDPGLAVKTWKERYGWALSPVPFCKDGWWIDSHRPQ